MVPIQHFDSDNDLLVRDGLILVFFSKMPFQTVANGIEKIFDLWLTTTPNNCLKWSYSTSSEVPSKFTSQTISKCRTQLDPQKAAKRELSGYIIMGPEKYNPSYRFDFEGSCEVSFGETDDPETNMIEMRFPTEFLQEFGTDRFVALATKMAALIDYGSGYASLSLNWSVDSRLPEAARIIVPIALRHPGYDVHMNDTTRYSLGNMSRGARWLTFLGDGLISRLGGRESLKDQLDPAIQILDAGKGLALRAGAEPLPGDVNRQDTLPLLHSVARAIQPVTLFGDQDLLQHLFGDDETRLERWERRFLRDE